MKVQADFVTDKALVKSLIERLRVLVNHDMASDIREGLEHCHELDQAIDLLDELDERGINEIRLETYFR